ncbi:nuclear factor of activated T-cells, cytoplasmic 3 isoform X2 [Gallus gallus]|uniref:nuclear factor of activated T-cells, cytoplasmic 3 isoform X2 n=1 Tax=Gallus gallus TaxID=9031 RepID=UPI000D63E669|nr:nuclear factor of activated T-cells, cytoplasmic 3 isoform X2 [Gallus gallus]XP_040536946.1 nuclear factor of activated T-cells, cytoplasmic 3 isoform X2 [Gallus gallus]XP_046755575.1 nuclear factor of activated T-cells, cytoplasmic 3 isoform X2 [Gallus gallus]XP_046781722.1 nuclear factor of activated T-cells, cytoplasmic 3 isoform X2 [Gallus gallus]|eukprot:XP_025010013.1 nuclear factor of activated T-cells, cytoplasmic 3 isoform X2 [Gallus gallus]
MLKEINITHVLFQCLQLLTNLESDDCASIYIFNVDQPSSSVNQPICIPRHGLQSHSSPLSPPARLQSHKSYEGTSEVPESKYSPLGGPKPFECPSIQITSISPNCHQGIEANEDELLTNGTENEYMERPSRDHLYLPLEPSYRESSLSPSPASSISSRSWFSDASSCESISHVYDDVDSELNEAAARFTLGSPLASPGGSPRGPSDESWQQPYGFGHALSPRQSPCHSPRTSITDENWLSPRPTSRPSSRPTSPCGKRRHSSAEICYAGSLSPHHSPTPSPGHSPRGSITEDTWLNTSIHSVQGLNSGLSPFQCCTETDIPLKTRKTSEDQTATLSGKIDICPEEQGNLSSSLENAVDDCSGSQHTLKKDLPGDQFLSVPSHFTWNKPKPGHTPIFRTSSLPPLDWPLPSHYGQCELKIEVQPKTHHRAHYETEGSRGAVKASTGGHPVVKLLGYSEKPVNLQMFIGTADDRYLRPHAFYQVHRITGKTVATASQEIIIASTKVLEIPLLPENNMSASIDCAGILKLRNSDIELRKGETDIGRKNTRVRLVFRVHIPQTSGKVLSLQTASIPVECSQRSAQELPQIEKYSINSCSVNGGHEMMVTGSNFLPESKIIFFEKGQDGRPQWEVEGKIIREKCQGANIILEVPPYHNKTITAAVQVQFYLCNGKRKKSQSQRFTYTPVIMKQEHRDEVDLSTVPSLALPHTSNIQGLHSIQTQLPSPEQGHPHDSLLSTSPRSLVCPVQPSYAAMVTSAVSHLSHMQGRNLSPSEECHVLPPTVVQSFQVTSAPPVRPSYQPMQSNDVYNERSGLPMNSASSQGFDAISFQQDTAVTHLINLSCQALPPMPFHSSNPGSMSTSSTAGHPLARSAHSGQSSSHLPSMGYHCPSAGQASIPSAMSRSLGQSSPQLQQVPYHSTNPASTSPSPTASHPLIPSPLSGPSSPQLQPLPYQSPSSGPASSPPPATVSQSGQHSPQAHSPALGGLNAATSLVHHTMCDSSPFSPDGAAINIKPEPEDRELNFQIGLQDITLDDDSFISDLEYQPSGSSEKWTQHSALMSNSYVENLEVNEIIGRDMSQISVSHGTTVATQSPRTCPGSLETRISDGIQ